MRTKAGQRVRYKSFDLFGVPGLRQLNTEVGEIDEFFHASFNREIDQLIDAAHALDAKTAVSLGGRRVEGT